MAARTLLRDFILGNRAYGTCTLHVWEVDAAGLRTSQHATLYADRVGAGVLPNPQRLDSEGKLRQPVYFNRNVIWTVDGLTVGTHESGVIQPDLTPDDVLAVAAQANFIAGLFEEITRAAARATAARSGAESAASSAASSANQIIALFETVQRRLAGQALLRSRNLSDVADADASARNLGLDPSVIRLYFAQHFT